MARFIELKHYLELSAVEVQLYFYFVFKQSRTMGKTVELPKVKIAEDLKMTRKMLDKCLDRLIELEYIKIESEPRKPLIVLLEQVWLNESLAEQEVEDVF